jgi:hypothetical protein
MAKNACTFDKNSYSKIIALASRDVKKQDITIVSLKPLRTQ